MVKPIREREIVDIRGVTYFVNEASLGYPFADDIPKTLVLERVYHEETKDSN